MRALLVVACAILTGAARADGTAAVPQPAEDIAKLRTEILEKMAAIDAQQQELLKKMAAVEQQRRDLELMMHRVGDLQDYRGGADAGGTEAPPAEVGTEQKAVKQAADQELPDLPRVTPAIGGVLSPQGHLVIEPSIEYAHSSVNRVSIEGFTILPALLIGVIDVLEADRDSVVGAITARYGITNKLELEFRVPYVMRNDTTRTRKFLTDTVEDSTLTADGKGMGDQELGLHYQFDRPTNEWPFIVGNVQVKAPTGTDPFKLASEADLSGQPQNFDKLATGSGFWTVNPSFTFIYPTDPVVFFGNLGYLWTLEDDKGRYLKGDQLAGFGKVNPGDAIRTNVGMGIGLNDRSSFSISYSLDLYSKTTIEAASEQKIAGSDITVGKLLLGFSLRLPSGTPLNLAIGIGATQDAPDTDITFRVPFTVVN